MRIRSVAVAVAGLAVVAATAGSAHAGAGTARSQAPSPAGNPASARAQDSGVCPDAQQIGETAHITRDGETIASVKQFYSPECQENYGYLWVWDSFHDGAEPYDVSVGVFGYDWDSVAGQQVWRGTTEQEFWSDGTDTVGQCTSAVGALRETGFPAPDHAATDKRC